MGYSSLDGPFIQYRCTKLYCCIIGVSCTIVLYDTVEWRVGGAIGPLGNGITSV